MECGVVLSVYFNMQWYTDSVILGAIDVSSSTFPLYPIQKIATAS